MAEAALGADNENDDKRLSEIFLEAWDLFEELGNTKLSTNSDIIQEKVKSSMANFEKSTRIVSEIGMFSSNELIDEVSTDSLQYLLLPYFLAKLAMKLIERERGEVLDLAEVYFKDYLKRCEEYELCDMPNSVTRSENAPTNEMAELMQAANNRNAKIAQFRRKKELEENVKKMKEAVRNDNIDEELKREFFLNFLKKSIIDAHEELDSLKLEKQMVQMRKMHMASKGAELQITELNEQPATSAAGHAHGHGHGHSHSHGHHQHGVQAPKPKPLQPFIITRNTVQKAVFGMGYPSLPVMTVDEFYSQRVSEGIFPDEEKVKRMNAAQAIAAAQDPNEKEDEEKAVVEEQIENDDPEYLARMRRMDEYKDVVRRGDGNRHNRS